MPLSRLLLDLLLAGMVAGDPDAPAPSATTDTARQVTVTVVGEPGDSGPAPAGKVMQFRILHAADPGSAAVGEKRKVAFLGVGTSPLAAAVRAQTTLGEDMGLSVDSVSPGSPAEAAGLKPFDILARYDDQLLCAPQQLAALVKRTGTGNKARLTVLRGGKEMPVEITVGEHEVTATMALTAVSVDGPGTLLTPPLQFSAPPLPKLGLFTPQMAGQGPKPMIVVTPETRSSSRSSSSSSDDQGTVILTEADGVRTVVILDAAGRQQYSGPLGDDLEAIPAHLHDRVRRVLPGTKR